MHSGLQFASSPRIPLVKGYSFSPATWMLLANLRNPETGRQAAKHPNPPEKAMKARSFVLAKEQTSESQLPGFPARVPVLKPGTYKDGTPLHEVQFLECKIFLKPDRFTSAKSFREYGRLVARAAKENDVVCTDKAAAPRPEIREVLFLDTADFSLYNHGFILRRRIQYKDGFPA